MPTPAESSNTTVADATQTSQTTETQSATPETFEAWLEGQDEKVKGLVAKRFEALENTARVRKEEREALADELKDLKKKKGDELQTAIDQVSAKLEIAEKRASFLEEAVNPAIECRNPGAAWVIAKAQDLFDKKGQPDWKAIRTAAPELFGKPIANANAGAGTQAAPAAKNDMNSFIRSRGGRG